MARKKTTVPAVENIVVPPVETLTGENVNPDYSVGGVVEMTRKTNIFALLSLFTAFLFFIPLNNVLSIIFGHVALKQLKRNPEQSGVGVAKAGLIISYIIVGFFVAVGLTLFGLVLWSLFVGVLTSGLTVST